VHLESLRHALPDLIAAGFIESIDLVESDAFLTEVTLAAPQA
jgi:hypothetical protein